MHITQRDFGFSIDLPHNKTMATAPLIAHTECYFPPELTLGIFSDKSDVYCYGDVCHLQSLFGIIC